MSSLFCRTAIVSGVRSVRANVLKPWAAVSFSHRGLGHRRTLMRTFHSSPCAQFSAEAADDDGVRAETVPIIFVDPLGKEIEVQAEIGKNLLEIAHEHDIELEGACGGELACATCHLIFEKEVYDTLLEKLDEEDDMLDLAFELTDTSRLGCQIKVREDFAGVKVRIPDDGY